MKTLDYRPSGYQVLELWKETKSIRLRIVPSHVMNLLFRKIGRLSRKRQEERYCRVCEERNQLDTYRFLCQKHGKTEVQLTV